MKRIVLCEGRTDAILISYFLNKTFEWAYLEQSPIDLPFDKKNETLNWYNHPEKPQQELAIWGVGGIDEMPKKLIEVVERTRFERRSINRFEKVVLFFDRADREDAACEKLILDWSQNANLGFKGKPKLGTWVNAHIDLQIQPPEKHRLNILSIVLPPGGKGELETFLLDSLRGQSANDQLLVDNARNFIDELPDDPYLKKKRFRPKACLGTVLSVMSPDWVFSRLDDRLTRVKWESLSSVASVYKKLEQL